MTKPSDGAEGSGTTRPGVGPESNSEAPDTDFTRVLRAIGWLKGDLMSVCTDAISESHPDGEFRSKVWPATKAVEQVAGSEAAQAGNTWFGVAPLRRDFAGNGRGKARDVRAIRAVYADLDVKEGGLGSYEVARAVIDDVSDAIGVQPAAVVTTGCGLQPYWRIARDERSEFEPGSEQSLAAAVTFQRFGRLVAAVAERHGGKVDSVFDLPRILRVPGTFNRKYNPPRPVTVEILNGDKIGLDQLDKVLDEAGIPEFDEDRHVIGPPVSPPREWTWAPDGTRCHYVERMVAGWQADEVGGRHPWLIRGAVRLATTHRLGLVTEDQYREAAKALTDRFLALLDRPGDARNPQPGEIASALVYGRGLAAGKTDAEAMTEVGGHVHNGPFSSDGCMVAEIEEVEAEDTSPPMVDVEEDKPPPGAGSRPSNTARYLADGPDGPGWYDIWDGVLVRVLSREENEGGVVDEESFWNARPELTHIRTYAWAQMSAPWAVLANELARVVCSVPPDIVLPSIIFGPASLNLTAALVAVSGGGKSGSTSVAEEAIRIEFAPGRKPYDTHTLGSGHGIAHGYGHRKAKSLDVVRHAESVLFTVEEVDHISALDAQSGSTVLAELRRFGMGEKLGHLFVDKTKSIQIPAHTYRGAIVVSVQPARAGVIIDAVEAGTPQRFFWAPAEDSNPPEVEPDCPEPWDWKLPNELPALDGHGRRPIPVCQAAIDAIKQAKRDRNAGKGDALDGHALLTRERIAAALGVLNGHYGITDEDWELAGIAMALSDKTRAHVVDTLAAKKRAANVARGKDEAERAAIVERHVENAAVQRVAKAIQSKLTREWITHSELRRTGVAGRDRGYFDMAIGRLVEVGMVEAETVEYRGRSGARYRLAEESS